MRDYVVQSGPLRTFETLFDPRFEKIRQVADYHTIEIIARPGTERRHIAELSRPSKREIEFVSHFFAPLAQGNKTIFGLRDVELGKADLLADRLQEQDRLKWSKMKYGTSDDDLVLVELPDFAKDMATLDGCVPPTAGEMFFYLTGAPFDVWDIYWSRAARTSLKAKEDRFRRDAVGFAHDAKLTLYQDQNGSFTVVVHPEGADEEAIHSELTRAGEKAGMSVVFAPGLFG